MNWQTLLATGLTCLALSGCSIPTTQETQHSGNVVGTQPKCSEFKGSEDSYNNHSICRYPQTTLQAAYQTWLTDKLNENKTLNPEYYTELKLLLPKLPESSQTFPIETTDGLRRIEYRISQRQAEILMTYNGGVTIYRFSQQRGYVELHTILTFITTP